MRGLEQRSPNRTILAFYSSILILNTEYSSKISLNVFARSGPRSNLASTRPPCPVMISYTTAVLPLCGPDKIMTWSPVFSGAPLNLLQTTRSSGQHVNMPKKYPKSVAGTRASVKNSTACVSEMMTDRDTSFERNEIMAASKAQAPIAHEISTGRAQILLSVPGVNFTGELLFNRPHIP